MTGDKGKRVPTDVELDIEVGKTMAEHQRLRRRAAHDERIQARKRPQPSKAGTKPHRKPDHDT